MVGDSVVVGVSLGVGVGVGVLNVVVVLLLNLSLVLFNTLFIIPYYLIYFITNNSFPCLLHALSLPPAVHIIPHNTPLSSTQTVSLLPAFPLDSVPRASPPRAPAHHT